MPTAALHHLVLSLGTANGVDLVSFHANNTSSVDGECIHKKDSSHLLLCKACSPEHDYDFHFNVTGGYIEQLTDDHSTDVLSYGECRLSCQPNASFHSQQVSRNWLNDNFLVLDLRWFVGAATALLFFCLLTMGHKHWKHRRLTQEKPVKDSAEQKAIRIFMDGAFDMMHYGHMNAFRLGRSLGTHLIVGVNSDDSITECKGGTPLMNDEERLTMVKGCKFVDEVLPECPYIMNQEYLDFVIRKYKIDFVVHGDDPCIVDGKDVYATAKEDGKFRTIPRTHGVSTTEVIGRMLLLNEERNGEPKLPIGRLPKFLTTSRMIHEFSSAAMSPTKDMRVIYMDGAWDMFHCGHVAALEAAKQVSNMAFSEATYSLMLNSDLNISILNRKVTT